MIVNRLLKRLEKLKDFTSGWLEFVSNQNKSENTVIITIESFTGKNDFKILKRLIYLRYIATFFQKENYEKNANEEKIEKRKAISSISAASLGTYYFPNAFNSNEMQLDKVIQST